jgi:hypothetical protein
VVSLFVSNTGRQTHSTIFFIQDVWWDGAKLILDDKILSEPGESLRIVNDPNWGDPGSVGFRLFVRTSHGQMFW